MRTETGPVVVIGGGVGPMAGVALHALIIGNTLTDGTDQSHLTVHHYSCSARIPDRTEYLLSHGRAESGAGDASSGDPALAMAGVFQLAARALDGRTAVGGVPCNTFHAPLIFDRFLALIEENCVGVRIVNMLEETMTLLGARLGKPVGHGGHGLRIGLLSTTGTRRSRVYDHLLEKVGYEAMYVSEEDQALLHASIYDQSWGIKATAAPTERAISVVSSLASKLVAGGATAVILACTELPLALGGTVWRGVPLVDPVLALARALIREAAPEKLKPLP
jgi:aspartate racemase